MDVHDRPTAPIDREAVLTAAGPELDALKKEARSAIRGFKVYFGAAFAFPIIMMLAVFTPLSIPFLPLLFIAFIIGVIVLAIRFAQRIFKARSRVMEALAPALGLNFTSRAANPFDLFTAFQGTYYGSIFKGVRIQDMLYGERHGAAFQIFDAVLTARSKGPDGKWRHGQPPKWLEGVAFHVTRVVRVEAPGRWTSRSVILKDVGLGIVNRLYQPKGMERVRLVDPKFEKVFEVFSTDQTEARAFLSPIVMERLLELEHLFEDQTRRNDETTPAPAVAVFADGALLLALPLDRFRKRGDGLRSIKLADVDDMVVDQIIRELDAVLGVVDAVAGAEAPSAA